MAAPPSLSQTADALVPVFYDDLRRIARRTRWQVSAGSTMQTTALVHEAYLKLRGASGFADRAHFLRAAAIAMRHVLVDLAREALTAKRGSGADAIPLDEAPEMEQPAAQALIEVNEALDRLRNVSERLAGVVECRFFAGYSEDEAATALGMSGRTVRRDWLKARAWLRRELGAPAEALDAEPTP